MLNCTSKLKWFLCKLLFQSGSCIPSLVGGNTSYPAWISVSRLVQCVGRACNYACVVPAAWVHSKSHTKGPEGQDEKGAAHTFRSLCYMLTSSQTDARVQTVTESWRHFSSHMLGH